MAKFNCGHHAGECPTVTTSEGTFCTLFGVELAGPGYVCTDMRQCCNRVAARLPRATAAQRAKQSIETSLRRELAEHKWVAAMARLYPRICEQERIRWAQQIRDWSVRLGTTPHTHPSIRQWAALFTATVCDKLATQGGGLCPRVQAFAFHPVDSKRFKGEFGFNCHKLNKTWRLTRERAIDASTGKIVVPFRPP